ncbi:MAG TPA: kinase inhibitor [Sporomusaceae bacterium]|jgi:inhibitor of KinA|nr:kinase inhibitor [Sporomusaceae bacterium]
MGQIEVIKLNEVDLVPFGETSILVEFGRGINPETHKKVKTLTNYLERQPFAGMLEYVSAFSSVTVSYDPMKVRSLQREQGRTATTAYEAVTSLLTEIIAKMEQGKEEQPREVRIPVCYGGEFGPDLAFVAEHNGCTPEEVIAIHSGGQYLVYMLGFAPGFPYLGGMSDKIAAPRRQSPRMEIPAGSVGIAGLQTGVYPIATPGGWQLIGRTPLDLFCPNEQPPTLLQAGDLITFYPISPGQYAQHKEDGGK